MLDRFKATLKYVQFFDVLVGCFRTSGFHLMANALEDVEKIRILVGLSVDRQAFEIIDTYQPAAGQLELDLLSSKQTKELFSSQVVDEIAHAEDSFAVETGIQKFISWLKTGKLEIKAHPSHSLPPKFSVSALGRSPVARANSGKVAAH